jgi:hypothetical protein
MSTRSIVPFLLILAAIAARAAGPAPQYKAPRTGNGQPDLQGVWNFSTDVPLERPAAFADRKFFTKEELEQQRIARVKGFRTLLSFAPVEDIAGLSILDDTPHVEDLRTSLITYPENGRLPKLLEGVTRDPSPEQIIALLGDLKNGPPPALLQLIAGFSGGKKDSHRDFGASERCMFGPSAPLVPELADNYVQIIQSRDHIALLTDMNWRIATLDGKPGPSNKLRTWSGDGRAHWEGETLVIETKNFNNRWRSFAGAGRSAEKVVTERFTRRSAKALDYEATVVDPRTFEDKVVIAFPMANVEGRVYENACHEHNYSLSNSLSAARADERAAAAKVKP